MDTQKQYSNIERELLAVVIVIKHLHHYVFGRHFTVHTDHSPLVSLFQKCLNDTSSRLQRLLLHLTQYQMDVKYVTRKCVQVANCLSRLIDVKSRVENELLNLQIIQLGVDNVKIDWDNVRKFTINNPTPV